MPAAMVFVRPTLFRFTGKSREKEMRVQKEKWAPNFIASFDASAKECMGDLSIQQTIERACEPQSIEKK
jgi:hypothetical protein